MPECSDMKSSFASPVLFCFLNHIFCALPGISITLVLVYMFSEWCKWTHILANKDLNTIHDKHFVDRHLISTNTKSNKLIQNFLSKNLWGLHQNVWLKVQDQKDELSLYLCCDRKNREGTLKLCFTITELRG